MNVIGLCGKAGAGKSTVARYLQDNYEVVVVSFADPLRNMLSPVIDQIIYEDTETPVSAFFNEYKEDVIEELGASPRKLLQDIGALMRGHNEDVFVNLAQSKINMLIEIDRMIGKMVGATSVREMVYVIDDVRYDNEARWINSHDGAVIAIDRDEKFLRKVPAHHSEKGVSPELVHFTYQNDNNIKAIKEIAEDIAMEFGIKASDPKPITDIRGSQRVH